MTHSSCSLGEVAARIRGEIPGDRRRQPEIIKRRQQLLAISVGFAVARRDGLGIAGKVAGRAEAHPDGQRGPRLALRIESGSLRRSSPSIASTSKVQGWTPSLCLPECRALKSE
jgi:hypothetical protein